MADNKNRNEITATVDTAVMKYLSLAERGLIKNSHLFDRIQSLHDDAYREWKSFAYGETSINGVRLKNTTGAYGQGIVQADPYYRSTDHTLVFQITSTSPSDEYIEHGHDEIDLKKSVAKSAKARRTPGGEMYLIVPFRHGTPGTNRRPMGKEVYDKARKLKASKVVGSRMEKRVVWESMANQGTVSRKVYKWGDSLNTSGLGVGKKKESPSSSARMYRFQNDSGGGSQYLTFRTMKATGSGWLIPARRGAKVADYLTRKIEAKLPEEIAKGIEEDLSGGTFG
jgi:hypothetical protein